MYISFPNRCFKEMGMDGIPEKMITISYSPIATYPMRDYKQVL